MDLHTSISRAIALAFALLVAFAALPAFAGTEEARKYFSQAKEAYAAEEYEKAAKLLEKAYSEEANLIYQYNRIRALQGADKPEKALEVLETYEKPMLDAEGFEDILDIKEELKAEVDDSTEAPESESKPEEEMASDPESTTDETAGGGGSSPLPWALIGGGGAVFTTGVLFSTGIFLPKPVRDQVREARQNNDGQVQFDEPGQESTFKTHVGLAYGFIFTGIAAAGSGTALLLAQNSGGSKSADLGRRLQVVPTVDSDHLGAQLRFEF